jgi:creatinine amidohydrolase/Fe(II)-dependent formamide hydrolase-like protein
VAFATPSPEIKHRTIRTRDLASSMLCIYPARRPDPPSGGVRMNRLLPLLLALCLPPAGAAAQKPPDTVFLEEFTWDEVRDLIGQGKTSVIIATAGTEQKGPHMAIGEHKFVLEYTTNRIARTLGNALVAPIITYVPEGSWENPQGHMSKAGTITLPNDRFMALLEHTARSLKAGGFKDILFLGDSGGNQNGMRDVSVRLNAEWKGSGYRAHFIGDYYTKSAADARRYLTEQLRVPADQIGNHAGMVDTSELMFVDARHVRLAKRAPGGGSADSGVSGDPTRATAEIGRAIVQIKIDNAVAQIRASLSARPEMLP